MDKKKLENDIQELKRSDHVISAVNIDGNVLVTVDTKLHYPDKPELPELQCRRKIELAVANYPKSAPVAFPAGWNPPKEYEHMNPDGSFCLEIPSKREKLFRHSPTLIGFLSNLLLPNLYSLEHFVKYGSYPFGEHEHGWPGIYKQHQSELANFNIKNEQQCAYLLRHFFRYRGHHDCYCGSGLRLRDCHGSMVRHHTGNTNRTEYRGDILAYQEKKRTK